MITCMSAKPHPVKNFLSCFLIKSDGGWAKIYHWSQSVKPHPIKNSKLMFPDQISRLHAHIFIYFPTHAFIPSCFMSSCSRFHASCSCPHAFMFMPSCSHGGLPSDG